MTLFVPVHVCDVAIVPTTVTPLVLNKLPQKKQKTGRSAKRNQHSDKDVNHQHSNHFNNQSIQ